MPKSAGATRYATRFESDVDTDANRQDMIDLNVREGLLEELKNSTLELLRDGDVP